MTDVMGYRSEQGGLGQDQAVSSQLRSILTSKLPLLSAPGSVIDNVLYYDVTSSTVSPVETLSTFAKDRITMNNMALGSAPTAYIPSQLFAGTLFWVVQLPDITVITAPTAVPLENPFELPQKWRFFAPQGWGFSALQTISVYVGASNMAQLEIDWYANFMLAMATCETHAKRQACIEGAGYLMDNYCNGTALRKASNATLIQGSSIFRSSGPGDWDGRAAVPLNRAMCDVNEVLYGGSAQAYLPHTMAVVPIRLPWASMAVLEKRLSLDTKLLSQPIQITLQTKSYSQIFVVGSQLTKPTAFASSSLQLWQEELSDKSLSLRNELLANPQFNVGYPFQYAQSMPFTFPASDSGEGNITYSGSASNPQQITMNITSIINSDLTTMMFMCTCGLRSTLEGVTVTNGALSETVSQYSPLFGEKLSNMRLELNGQRIFSFDEGIYDHVSLAKQMDKLGYTAYLPWSMGGANINSLRPNLTSASTPSMGWGEGAIYELNFSRIRAIIAESHLQNTARYTNQTFQLVFNVERTANYNILEPYGTQTVKASALAACKQKMELHVVYLYNGVYLIGGDGGTSKLITN